MLDDRGDNVSPDSKSINKDSPRQISLLASPIYQKKEDTGDKSPSLTPGQKRYMAARKRRLNFNAKTFSKAYKTQSFIDTDNKPDKT